MESYPLLEKVPNTQKKKLAQQKCRPGQIQESIQIIVVKLKLFLIMKNLLSSQSIRWDKMDSVNSTKFMKNIQKP